MCLPLACPSLFPLFFSPCFHPYTTIPIYFQVSSSTPSLPNAILHSLLLSAETMALQTQLATSIFPLSKTVALLPSAFTLKFLLFTNLIKLTHNLQQHPMFSTNTTMLSANRLATKGCSASPTISLLPKF